MVADPMNICQRYYIAKSIPDALETLADSPHDSLIIAGGTDLLLDIQQGRHPQPHTLIDVTGIQEMTALEIRGNELFIGASVLHRTLHTSQIVTEHCYALKVASGLIGGPQVRNAATIGGNIAHALPAADGTIALMAMDAMVEIASSLEKKKIPIVDLFLGPGKSTLNKHKEILVGIYVKLKKPYQASAFNRIMRPQGVAIAILNTAVWLERQGDVINDIRIAVGPSGPIPRRMTKAENIIKKQILTEDIVHQAYQVLLQEAQFRTSSYRASKEYREKMAEVLLKKTIYQAYERSYTDDEE